MAVDASGNVYVADINNDRIQKFDSSGGYLTNGAATAAATASSIYPRGVTVDAAGNVYVADTGNHRIQKFDSSGDYLGQWGSNGSGDGQFNSPDRRGQPTPPAASMCSDSDNNRIQKFDSSGGYLAQWGTPAARRPVHFPARLGRRRRRQRVCRRFG